MWSVQRSQDDSGTDSMQNSAQEHRRTGNNEHNAVIPPAVGEKLSYGRETAFGIGKLFISSDLV